MKIRIGDYAGGQAHEFHDGMNVQFVAQDSRVMFEISSNNDGKSIGILGVNSCIVDGVRYDNRFNVRPNAANSVTIEANKYD
jgi:hypothetical protein